MNEQEAASLIAADKAHAWHPFTQMRDWCDPSHEPLLLTDGRGAILRDAQGREYIDGNSSIWTNLHGHRNPRLDAALAAQLDRVAHTSFLGFSNPPAAQLARELCELFPAGTLTRAFFSDDGSTAIEVAIKMTIQYWQLAGQPHRQLFLAFRGGYHGDTMGASSVGGVSAFHDRFSAHHFPVRHLGGIEELKALEPGIVGRAAAVIIEPLIQGAAGMHLWPKGLLAELKEWCKKMEVLLILDEVMTGFGRTGTMFACEQEGVVPDFIALAKGLTGGYLPLAATLTTEQVFNAFLGTHEEIKTFFYGHSYAGNQLGCAVALENLAIFRDENVLDSLQAKIGLMTTLLSDLREKPFIGEIRQCGFIAGIDIVRPDGSAHHEREQVGARVCIAARRHGLLTRPIRDTVVVMPPYCITSGELKQAIGAVENAALDLLGDPG